MITDPSQFRRMFDTLSSAALTAERLPAQVFRPQYDRFRFLEFALFPNPEFLTLLKRLMESSCDIQTNLIMLEPDPEAYFYKNFGNFAALEIGADESWENYRAQMDSSPESSPADSLAVNSFSLVWFPPSLRWIIWAERSPDLMVLAYCRGFNGPSGQSLAETGMTPLSAEDALDISSSAWSDRIGRRDFARKVMDNYAGGRPWVDDAPERAIAVARRILAGEIGLIEGCRALSSMRWELWDDVRDRFIPFVAIDSETDDLPIGAVRDLWQPDALARKDLEISRCEQLYRKQVAEACMALIESLGPDLAQPQSKDLP
jgi:hypothetical protein